MDVSHKRCGLGYAPSFVSACRARLGPGRNCCWLKRKHQHRNPLDAGDSRAHPADRWRQPAYQRQIDVKTAPHDAIPTSGDVTNAVHDQQLSVGNLLQEKAELQLALNTLPIGLCMYDSEQRLILCNLQYAKMYNIPPELTRQG